jgi:hypothetical protein
MRRLLTGVVTLALAATALLATVPAVAAAASDFSGTWVSTDSDGSTQALSVGRGASPAVTYLDFYANSCATAGSPSTQFVANGRGSIDGASMWVDFRNGGCGRHKLGAFGLEFLYDGGSDTLTDSFGITWSRFP